jgi:hypothetical protein
MKRERRSQTDSEDHREENDTFTETVQHIVLVYAHATVWRFHTPFKQRGMESSPLKIEAMGIN